MEMALVRLAKAIAEGRVQMRLGDLERLLRVQQMIFRHQDTSHLPRTGQELAAHVSYLVGHVPENIVKEAIDYLQTKDKPPATPGTPVPGGT